MSWLRDSDGALHNLDHVQRLIVLPMEGEPKEDTDSHALCAYYPDAEEPAIILTGTEEYCAAKLSDVYAKLPKVSP